MSSGPSDVGRVENGRGAADELAERDPAITFSFGENWRHFAGRVDESRIERALRDITEWIGVDRVKGERVLDIGCGSGIHSLCFHMLGAHRIRSFDLDPQSVVATSGFFERAGGPSHWEISQGSVLDEDFMSSLGRFDLVYAWGVLHHTGAMWEAVAAAARCVEVGGHLWIALYAKGDRYAQDLRLKRAFNRASPLGKKLLIGRRIVRRAWKRLKRRRNPLAWNQVNVRGMDVYHDIVDWLGGLPYEVANVSEVEEFLRARGFELERVERSKEGGNSIYLLRRSFFADP